MNDNPEVGNLLTIADLADRLAVGERFVRRLVAERRIGYLKVGAKVRFTLQDVEAYVASCRKLDVSYAVWEPLTEAAASAELLDLKVWPQSTPGTSTVDDC